MKKIIQLEEFPDTIYLSLSDSDHKKLWKNLLKNISIKQVAEEFKIPVRNLYKYKEGDSGYPLAILKKLLKKTKIKINQANIKTQRNSNSMKIKIPIRITEKFTEFLGYLFGDGGIDHQFGVHFTTNDKKSLNQFDNLVKEVFGDIEKQEYDYGTRITYYYPKILGVLLSEIFKIPKGNKVDSDIEIPDDILNSMNSKMKRSFITSFYICDGCSDYIRIVQGGKNLEKPPKILTQIQEMIRSFNFNSAIIKPSSIYFTSKTKRRRWVLNISDQNERKKFKIIFLPSYLN
ncbi:MAG: hypothetical protein GW780_04190 [Candidatus Aenigmarchaeota archaeon]|nr:hypothetical protein [Candidatus Aenigmarchaeota archaeon]NCS71335.1 hypothetical protein [Candidatus Aenigmarchaeota archaeon]OIP30691.1 MAG: hypothetical protein AUK23_08210 [Deltaproteobacteria bacterium CG2_30_43_15]